MSLTSKTFRVTMLAMLCIGIALSAAEAAAKAKVSKAKLIGSWTLVSITNTSADGKTVQTYGPGDGVLIIEANGEFVQVLARPDLPKFASNNRNTGSPDENKAVVQGALALFGKYTVDTKEGSLTLRTERGTFPNWNGTDQKRIVDTLTASELKWEVPAPSIGGSSVATWKRNK